MKRNFIFIIAFLLLLITFGCRSFIPSVDTINEPYENFESDLRSIESPLPIKTVVPEKPEEESVPSGEMKVHFIDVGQGDAIFIETPSKKILIDGGNRGSTVVDYLKNQGVDILDLVICTHPHTDHIGGLINVFESIPVKEVIDPGVVHTTKTFEDYLTLIDEKEIRYTVGRTGISRDFGDGAAMSIIHPSSVNNLSLNDASVVLRMTFGQVVFLLTGDVESYGEEQILTYGYDLKSTVLKVGHHGSNSGTTSSFLEAVSPEVAVIMVGKGNRYGHPHDENLMMLANSKVDIYRADIHGTIVITTNGQTYEVNQKQPYQYNPPKIPEPPERQSYRNKININTAGVEQLQEIIHIGPVRAKEIIGLRPFNSVDELIDVSGIGPVRLEDIKKEGKACVD